MVEADNSDNISNKRENRMFSSFLNFFNRSVQYDIYGNEYRTFVIAFGGMQFGKGLFNAFDKGDLRYWEKNILNIFPEYKGKFELFGYDWMGRCFAVTMLGQDEEKILVFDPSTLEVNDIPLCFMDFVNKAIPTSTNECFSADAFINWHNTNGVELEYLQCLGNKVPLFLGGNDELDNMEVSDMDVYWHILGQTAAKLRDEEEGTVVDEFTIEEENEEDEFYANQADEAGDFFDLQKKRIPYIRKNVDTYLEKFKKMHNKDSKISWNWCAFLFCEFWFAYRKMYGVAALVWGIPYVLGIVLGVALGFSGMDMESVSMIANAGGVVIGFAFMVFVAMFGDNFYRKKIDKLIAMGESAESQEELQQVVNKGGTSGKALAIAMVLSVAASLLVEFI